MAGGIDLTTLIAQLPHLSKIVTAEHTHPGVQRTLLFQNALDAVQQGKEQVEQVQQSASSRKVKEEKRQRNHPEQQHFVSVEDDEEEEPPSTNASNASPWSGNILDLEV